jgi:23S rRNA-/tRNA-specific pseudouridylate synthase
MRNSWIVQTEENECRLNTFLKRKLKDSFTTKQIAWAIEHNGCEINGKLERFLSKRLQKGDRVNFQIEKSTTFTYDKSRILFEDDHLLAYNKPDGISSTDLSTLIGFELVHRLDRDTTGVILFAKSAQAKERMESLFKQKRIRKTYFALVWGVPHETGGMIEEPMGIVSRREGAVIWGVMPKGVPAKTEWLLEKSGSECAFLICHPYTGRTHQIRVHLKAMGHPILGDAVYGPRKLHPQLQAKRPMLHAAKIEFKHPFVNKMMRIEVSPPEDFELIFNHQNF